MDSSPHRLTFFQNLFTTEEEQHIIHLKEGSSPELSWEAIHERFIQRFPKSPRSKGGLQVHYSRKLQPSKRNHKVNVGSSAPAARTESDEEFLPRTDHLTGSSKQDNTPTNRPQRSATKARYRSYINIDDSDSTLSPTDSQASLHFSMEQEQADKVIDEGTQQDPISQLSAKHGKQNATVNLVRTRLIRAPSKAVKAAKLMTQDRDGSPQMEGWVPADLEQLKRTSNAPQVFLTPPPNRIVEFNMRSGAYRIRCRRAGDPPASNGVGKREGDEASRAKV